MRQFLRDAWYLVTNGTWGASRNATLVIGDKGMTLKTSAIAAALVACCLQSAWASDAGDYGRMIQTSQNIDVLGKDLAGDVTNFHNGATSFGVEDLSLPGNNALRVAIGRSYDVSPGRMGASVPSGTFPVYGVPQTRKYAFGNWDLDVPFVSGTYGASWQIRSTTPLNRCSVIGQQTGSQYGSQRVVGDPASPTQYEAPEVPWRGLVMHVPGEGDQVMLLASLAASHRPTSGGPYHWVTNKDWWVSCLTAVANPGGSGEGFMAIAPDGTKYTFNWMSKRPLEALSNTVSMNEDGVSPPFKTYYTFPYEHIMLPTRVEDRFGNYVTYAYSSDEFARLLSITSSDQRQITLAYNASGFVQSVSDGTRTVQYVYAGNALSQVITPDGSRWTYGFSNLDAMGVSAAAGEENRCQSLPDYVNFNCIGYPQPQVAPAATAYVIHPSGARVDFGFGMHFAPTIPPQQPNPNVWQHIGRWHLGITEKTISGPGVTPAKWYYAFKPNLVETQAQCRAGACPTRVWTDEVSPEFRIQRRMYGLQPLVDEGIQLQELEGYLPNNTTTTTAPTTGQRLTRAYLLNDIDLVEQSTPVTVTTTTVGMPEFYKESDFTYRVGARVGEHPFSILAPATTNEVFWNERRLPVSQRATYVQGASFTWQATQWDALDRATTVSKASSLNPGKTESTQYLDNLGAYVLGMVATRSVNGVVAEETQYDANLLPWKVFSFGRLMQTYTYNADGTLATSSDPRDGGAFDTTVVLSNWKRGTPQLVRFPATPESPGGSTKSAVVANPGWVDSVTDENGFTTSYVHDMGGRLTSITPPSDPGAPQNATTISFVAAGTAKHGLPVGHWQRTVTTGNGVRVTYHDAMWRPVVEESFDASNKAATLSQVVKRYDSDSREVYQSTALRTLSDYNAAMPGTRTYYDALGRVARTEQDSEIGLLVTTRKYLDGFKRETVDARGRSTVESFQAFESPSFDAPIQVDTPEHTRSTIVRDVFGKPTDITRGSTN
jgi:hypothetical protein